MLLGGTWEMGPSAWTVDGGRGEDGCLLSWLPLGLCLALHFITALDKGLLNSNSVFFSPEFPSP
jgi:hypothetical protein